MRLRKIPGTDLPIQRQHKGISVVMLIASIVFGLYALSLIIPLAWGIIMSFQDRLKYITDKTGFPNPMHPENYINAFTQLQASGNNMFIMIFNSLWYSSLSPIIAVFTTLMASYVCAKYKFILNKIIYWIAIVTMMIPITGSLPAALRLSQSLGIYDNPLTLISAIGGLGSTFVIGFAFFKGVDWAYAESAFIDGASHARVFFQIMVPQAVSPIIALSLTMFISHWNDATGPLIYLPSYPTLSSGFYIYQIEAGRMLNYPVYFAGLFIAALPIIALYIAFQDTLMNLNMGGGLKG
jgi:raffinose/stachyose/melibiose transport system permease protein/N-acetylglucosamine transport system permease protein